MSADTQTLKTDNNHTDRYLANYHTKIAFSVRITEKFAAELTAVNTNAQRIAAYRQLLNDNFAQINALDKALLHCITPFYDTCLLSARTQQQLSECRQLRQVFDQRLASLGKKLADHREALNNRLAAIKLKTGSRRLPNAVLRSGGLIDCNG